MSRRRNLVPFLLALVVGLIGLPFLGLTSPPAAYAGPGDENVRINEISLLSPNTALVELINSGSTTANMNGATVRSGGTSAVLSGNLPPGERLVLAVPLASPTRLVEYFSQSGPPVDSHTWQSFDDPATSFERCLDGTGEWRVSAETTMGFLNCSPLLINEVQVANGAIQVEVINPSSNLVRLDGHVLNNGSSGNTLLLGNLAPGEREVYSVGTSAFNAVYLRDTSGTIDVDRWAWGNEPLPATSWGRCPDGSGAGMDNGLTVTTGVTLDGENACGPLVLNEVITPDGHGGDGRIELHNISTDPVPLAGWTVDPGFGAPFPLAGTLPGGGTSLHVVPMGSSATVRLLKDNNQVDEFTYAAATAATSYGRCPNGTGPFLVAVTATPGAPNDCRTPMTNTGVPTISGDPRVGNVLTASGGTWSPAPDTVSYQWFAEGAPGTPLGSGATYTPTAADRTKSLYVVATPAKPGHVGPSARSTSVTIDFGQFASDLRPSISGTPKVGQTLTVVPGTWTQVPSAVTYAWTVDGDNVGSGTTLVVPSSAALKTVRLTATASRPGYADATATATAGPVALGTFTNTRLPVIQGSLRVGQALTVAEGAWTPDPSVLGYEWYVGNTLVHTGLSYTPTNAQVGSTITAVEIARRPGYEAGRATSPPVTVLSGDFVNNALPTITGTAQVGRTLTAHSGDWTPDPDSSAWQWYADNQLIPGATGATYVPTVDELGEQVTVRETVARTDGSVPPKAATSAPTAKVVPGLFVNDARPTITGVVRVGEELTAHAGDWTPDPVASTWQWYADGNPIAGAAGATYVLTAQELGQRVTVVQTATRPGYVDGKAESVQTAAVLPGIIDNLTLPGVTGDVRAHGTVRASTGTWDPSVVNLAYQWYVDGAAVPGATSDSFVLRASDLGSRVSVRVTAAKPGYNPTTVEAPWVGPVQTCVFRQTQPVEVRGQAVVGTTLEALPGAWAPEPGSTTYQWYADGELIAGATQAGYTLTPAELGERVTVTVTVSKTGCEGATAQSSATGDIEPGTLKTLVKPQIVGDLVVGEELSLEGGEWDADPATLTYQWTRGGVPIPGATDASYTPTSDDVTKWLAVLVIVSAPGYDDLQVVTPAAFPVAPVKSENLVAPSITGGARIGETLTADPGEWSFGPETLVYEWFAGARRIGVGSGPRLVLDDPAWVGEAISVKVTASSEVQPPVSASSERTAAVRKGPAAVEAEFSTTTPKAKRTKVKVDVTVTAPAGLPVTGQVRVLVADRRVLTARLGDGSARITLPVFPAKGERTVVIRYDGSPLLGKAVSKTVVRVR
ncbi:hypothetical protein HNR19_003623 [Nocardioides thalensis]|uniref:LTD domain-containing protein n=1 Tax=Nocardioides thalensis TaxID=1914755 RepID=A0A853C580_9ACTN|nr:hypothetical protein [Nocardioides thalensis]NYJ02925.1 hypothetical protein [Nocardioides thalensis]